MDMFISVVAMVFFALVRLSTNTVSHVFVHYGFCFYQQIWRPPKRCTFVFFDYSFKQDSNVCHPASKLTLLIERFISMFDSLPSHTRKANKLTEARKGSGL